MYNMFFSVAGLQELYFPTPGAREKLSRARISPTYHFPRNMSIQLKSFHQKAILHVHRTLIISEKYLSKASAQYMIINENFFTFNVTITLPVLGETEAASKR